MIELKGKGKIVLDNIGGFIGSFSNSEKLFKEDFSETQFNNFLKWNMDLEYEDIKNIPTKDFMKVLKEAYEEVKGEKYFTEGEKNEMSLLFNSENIKKVRNAEDFEELAKEIEERMQVVLSKKDHNRIAEKHMKTLEDVKNALKNCEINPIINYELHDGVKSKYANCGNENMGGYIKTVFDKLKQLDKTRDRDHGRKEREAMDIIIDRIEKLAKENPDEFYKLQSRVDLAKQPFVNKNIPIKDFYNEAAFESHFERFFGNIYGDIKEMNSMRFIENLDYLINKVTKTL